MNLWLSLNKALVQYGNKRAIFDGDKQFTYRQVGERIAGLAQFLQTLGLQTGDVVAIAAPNCHEYFEAYYACAVTGIVLLPVNYRLASCEISAILEDAGAKLFIAHTDFALHLGEILNEAKSVQSVVWFGNGQRLPISAPAHDYETAIAGGSLRYFDSLPYLAADQLCNLYYTSGTTGLPKGVMLTQGNITFNSLAAIADLFLTDTDCWLHAAPMFHLADAWATFAITWAGGTHVFIPYFNALKALEAFEQHRTTVTVLVPTMLNAMLNEHAHSSRKYDCSSWRCVLTGGAPAAPDMVRRTVQTFNCEYLQLYGMTETSPFLTLSRPKNTQSHITGEADLQIRAKTGRGYIGAEVKVVRPDGTDVEPNDLEVGQIVARGPTIFAGYWKKPEATAQTIKNGWIQTGDLATIDAEGFINIVDRAKDMIITGGENVYSTEVEHALQDHPGVLECAVFGVPDKHWGEAVKAVVVARKGFTLAEQELIAFLRERLAGYKVPRSIDFLKELPKTGSGKIYKKGLREQYWHDFEKQVN